MSKGFEKFFMILIAGVIISCFQIIPVYLFSQQDISLYPDVVTDTVDVNDIRFGVDKSVNTYFFRGFGNLWLSTDYGSISLYQNYRGSAIETSTNSFRDDELMNIGYRYPITDYLWLNATMDWLLSSDTRNIGINKLDKLNSKFGLGYKFLDNSYFKALAGPERNIQIGVNARGWTYLMEGLLKNYNFDNYNIFAKAKQEYTALKPDKNISPDRTDSDMDVFAGFSRAYEGNNYIGMDFKYRRLSRDFLNALGGDDHYLYSVENRLENNFNTNLNLRLNILNLPAEFKLSVSDKKVARAYDKSYEVLSISGIERISKEFNMDLSVATDIDYGFGFQKIGMDFFSRTEENTINNKYGISEDEEDILRNRENQRDNNAFKTRLFSVLNIPLGLKDSINFDYSMSLLQYDTPSEQNYDDRDELNILAGINYSRIFSPFLRMSLQFDFQLTHLVFLKAQRSALNNINRILRFNPKIEYRIGRLMINPSLEVLANYTVYDFEDISPGINSFSFRQFAYRDSMAFRLDKHYSLSSGIILRYNERGILYWDKFAETPQSSQTEQFVKLMLIYSNLRGNLNTGIGVRFYGLKQDQLKKIPGTYISGQLDHKSYSPEFMLRYSFESGTRIDFDGWYEFRNINGIDSDEIPNFFLTVNYKL